MSNVVSLSQFNRNPKADGCARLRTQLPKAYSPVETLLAQVRDLRKIQLDAQTHEIELLRILRNEYGIKGEI